MAAINIKELFSLSEDLHTKSLNALIRALKDGATNNFDYLRFKSSIKSLGDLDLTESQSFKSAFTTAQTIGVTKDKLVKSANYYKTLLNKELDKFGTAMQSQYKQRVTAKEEEAKKYEKRIRDTEIKIKNLSKELDAFKANIETLNNAAVKENEKIVAAKEKFLGAFNEIKNSIESDVQLMQDYL